jgi:hypothetical protein
MRNRSPSGPWPRYGRLREAFERTVDLMRVDMCYLELTPDTHP